MNAPTTQEFTRQPIRHGIAIHDLRHDDPT